MNYKNKRRIIFIFAIIALIVCGFIWMAIGYAVMTQLYDKNFGLDYPENVMVAFVYFIFSAILLLVLPAAFWLDKRMHKSRINRYINGNATPGIVKRKHVINFVKFVYHERLFSPRQIHALYFLLIVFLVVELIIVILTSKIFVDILFVVLIAVVIVFSNPKQATILIYNNGIYSYHLGTEKYIDTVSIENIYLKEKQGKYEVSIMSLGGDRIEIECYNKYRYNSILYHLQGNIKDKWSSVLNMS